MNYKLLTEEKVKRVRQAFEVAFIETPEEFMASTLKWREKLYSENPNAPIVPIPKYDEVIYWAKIKNYKEATFAEALSFLSNISNPVYFMSDLPLNGYVNMHFLNDPKATIGFIAVHNDAKEFAQFIYDEWKLYNTFDCEQEGAWFEPLLPDDLYVFDDSFSWLLVFTHHNADDFDPDRPRSQNSYNRACFVVQA